MSTPPRQVLPGTVYLVTRRSAQREFLLKPTERTTAIFKYVLAVAAQRTGIRLHAACVLSNHYHLVLTDPHAALPRFCQLLDGLLARVLNASYGRWESFWAPASYSAVELVTAEDVVEKIAYTLANPAAAGLVAHGEEWPGLWTSPEQIGGTAEIVARPEVFFSKTGTMPERAPLRFRVPAAFDSPDAFRTAVRACLSSLERKVADDLAAKGRRVLGLRRLRKQKRTDHPAPGEPRRKLNPRVACKDEEKRREALDRLVQFRRTYRAALQRLRDGARRVVFPSGTYLLRVHLGVACAAA
jgi:REP element-mobilizing transposase RayT